jgi:hypothetical protein
MGEWTPEAHINLGRGPHPTPSDFLPSVDALLR